MTRNDSFRRKIIYIVAIAVLLIPLSVISQPATVSKSGEARGGGLLSQKRKDHRLSQAELSDIDPASESMKLATLGLRPVAVTLLWGRIQEAKKKEQWDRMRTSTQTLIALQPNFIKVWEFQAHNLSYNISREFDDYQYRYHWVKEGLSYLMTGIGFNRKDHRIYDQLGFFFGLKLGRSDEKSQFRRLFRKDADYHEKLKDHGISLEDAYSAPLGGTDNWLTAYQWYNKSRLAVDNGLPRRTSGIMFYKGAPSQLRNYAIDLEREQRPDNAAQQAWEDALDEWVDYGNREIRTSTQVPVFLDRLSETKQRMEETRGKLDEMFPKVREELMAARRAKMTPEMWEAYNTPLNEMVNPDMGRLHHVAKGIMDDNRDAEFSDEIEKRVADGRIELSQDDRDRFERLKLNLNFKMRDLEFVAKYRGTVNYSYWKDRCQAESELNTIQARADLYDAREAVKETKFDEQEVLREKRDANNDVVIDDKTGLPVMEKVKVPGAIQFYEASFRKWKDVFKSYKSLADDVMEDDLVQAMQEYYGNLRKVQADWPLDFPLQALVDKRALRQLQDGLPTTESLQGRIQDLKELQELEKANNPVPQSQQPPAGKEAPAAQQPGAKSPETPEAAKSPEKPDGEKSPEKPEAAEAQEKSDARQPDASQPGAGQAAPAEGPAAAAKSAPVKKSPRP